MATKKNVEVKFSEYELKHLDYLQNIITRMNSNSFQMKGWMVAIVSALLAVFTSTSNKQFVLIAIFPALIFWFLDTYYLWQERKFRGQYNDVAKVSDNPKEFKLLAMRPDLYTGGKYSYWDVFSSITIILVYLPVIGLLLAIYLMV